MVLPDDQLLFDSAFLASLAKLELLARKHHASDQSAERRARRLGASLEYADHRNYAFGDDPRRIDWNIYGRLDRLFVKLYEAEQDLPVHFLVDASASMRWRPEEKATPRSKFDQARRLAAALSHIALTRLDRVNLHRFTGESVVDVGSMRGRGQFHKVLDFLRETPPEKTSAPSLEKCLQLFAQRQKRRGMVFLLSDLFDPAGFERGLAVLRHHHFEVEVLQILDPAELDPALRGDLRLLDCETGRPLDVTAQPGLVRKYREAIRRYCESAETFCRQRAFGYLRLTCDQSFEDIVLRILREERVLR